MTVRFFLILALSFLLAKRSAAQNLVHVFTGENPGDRMSQSSVVGDLDGDRAHEIIIGTFDGNYARLFRGAEFSQLREYVGLDANDQFGHSVAGIGDYGGDGTPDFVIGTRGKLSPSGISANYVQLFSGADLDTPLDTIWGTLGSSAGSATPLLPRVTWMATGATISWWARQVQVSRPSQVTSLCFEAARDASICSEPKLETTLASP